MTQVELLHPNNFESKCLQQYNNFFIRCHKPIREKKILHGDNKSLKKNSEKKLLSTFNDKKNNAKPREESKVFQQPDNISLVKLDKIGIALRW